MRRRSEKERTNFEKDIDKFALCPYTVQVRGSAGIGRQARLRGVCASVWVQVPSAAPKQKKWLYQPLFCYSPDMDENMGIVFLLENRKTS